MGAAGPKTRLGPNSTARVQVPTIEVNGTYYSGFKPDTYAKWSAETPDGFVFSIKGNRFVTNRKVLVPLLNEILGARLATIHNLHYYLNLMREIRAALDAGSYSQFRAQFRAERAHGV